MAFITSLIRNMLGTGSLLAFPGSMFGAFLCAILFKYTKNTIAAFVGEVLGTGLIGAICAYFVATLIMSKEAALFTFVIPFGISTLVGASVSLIFITAMKKTGIINKINAEAK
jgi:energy coupling factor transporter S component ThiW